MSSLSTAVSDSRVVACRSVTPGHGQAAWSCGFLTGVLCHIKAIRLARGSSGFSFPLKNRLWVCRLCSVFYFMGRCLLCPAFSFAGALFSRHCCEKGTEISTCNSFVSLTVLSVFASCVSKLRC